MALALPGNAEVGVKFLVRETCFKLGLVGRQGSNGTFSSRYGALGLPPAESRSDVNGVEEIHQQTNGVPRLVNRLAYSALMAAACERKDLVDGLVLNKRSMSISSSTPGREKRQRDERAIL